MDSADAFAGSDWFSDEAATFGDRVAAARRALGLSQERLARKLGVKLRTLANWENDMAEPRANRLQMLAGVLNVSIVWLLTGEGEGVADPWAAPVAPPAEGVAELVADIRAIRTRQRQLDARLARLERRLMALAGGGPDGGEGGSGTGAA